MSAGGDVFDNSAFNRLAAPVVYNHNMDQSDDMDNTITYSRSLSKISEESRSYSPSRSNSPIQIDPTMFVNDSELESDIITTPLSPNYPSVLEQSSVVFDRDFSFPTEATPSKSTATTPSPDRSLSESTPAKKSKLPVMKHLRRFSMSPAQNSKASKSLAKPATSPFASKKTTKVETNKQPTSRSTPAKATPVKPSNSSRLPTFVAMNSNNRNIADSGRKVVRRLSQMIS